MALNQAAINLMLDYLGTRVGYLSLHSGDPSTTGANEITGGSPAYARKAVAWSAASTGSMSDSTNGIDFDIPAGTTVRYVGLWTTVTTGTFYGSDDVTNETFAAQGVYRLTDFTITGT